MSSLLRQLDSAARFRFGLALLLSAVAGASGIALLGLSGWFLTASALAGVAGAGHSFNHLYPSAGVRGFAFTRVISRYAEQLVGHDATLRFSSRLRASLFGASARSHRGFTPLNSGALSALVDDVDTVESGFLRVLSPAAAVAASVLVALGFVVAADPLLALVTFVLAGIAGFILPRQASHAARQATEQYTQSTEQRRARIANLVENAVELDVYGALPTQCEKAADELTTHQRELDNIERPFRRLHAINTALGGVLVFLLLYRNGASEAGLAITAGASLALLAAFDGIGSMAKVLDAAPRARASAGRLSTLMEAPAAVPNPSVDDAKLLETPLPIIAENLIIRASPEAPAIGPLDFTISPGQVTLLTGPSGSGKTTLMETLLRLHPLESGELTYGGVTTAETRTAAVLAHLAVSPQFEAYLPGTVRDQFRLADPEVSDDRIWEALAVAGLDDVIRSRGGDLDHRLREGDPGLSGGEMRRLSLARALVTLASVLILDEPFAGLEPALAGAIARRLADWTAAGDRSLIIALHENVETDWAPLDIQTIDLGTVNASSEDGDSLHANETVPAIQAGS